MHLCFCIHHWGVKRSPSSSSPLKLRLDWVSRSCERWECGSDLSHSSFALLLLPVIEITAFTFPQGTAERLRGASRPGQGQTGWPEGEKKVGGRGLTGVQTPLVIGRCSTSVSLFVGNLDTSEHTDIVSHTPLRECASFKGQRCRITFYPSDSRCTEHFRYRRADSPMQL